MVAVSSPELSEEASEELSEELSEVVLQEIERTPVSREPSCSKREGERSAQ